MSRTRLFLFYYVVIIKNYKVKKLFNKFPEISGKIGINFRKFPEIFRRKFPEISELTTLNATIRRTLWSDVVDATRCQSRPQRRDDPELN